MFWHGTHVAGIVAASYNHIGTVGSRRSDHHRRQGPARRQRVVRAVIQGILYAATPISEAAPAPSNQHEPGAVFNKN